MHHNNRIDFQQLKAKVGIDDVAYQLGYRLDRRAGVGRYIELVSKEGDDKIIIKNPRNKAEQSYFRRNGMGGGDVMTFIREHLTDFHEYGRNEWENVARVLARMTNEPLPDRMEMKYTAHSKSGNFDADRYEAIPATERMKETMAFLVPRGLRRDTLEFFAPHLSLVRDKQREGDSYINLGFPYRVAGKDQVVGYELRGFGGFKSKAVGTNSTTGVWMVTKAIQPNDVRHVYFAESGFDIMAFYQANRLRIDVNNAAYVSLGGTFSNGQVSTVMQHFSKAKAMDCFDNDLPGHMAGLRMAALLEGVALGLFPIGDKIKLVAEGKSVELLSSELSLKTLANLIPLHDKVGLAKPTPNFKDWNDQILGKPMTAVQSPTKFDRDRNLEERRKVSRKM